MSFRVGPGVDKGHQAMFLLRGCNLLPMLLMSSCFTTIARIEKCNDVFHDRGLVKPGRKREPLKSPPAESSPIRNLIGFLPRKSCPGKDRLEDCRGSDLKDRSLMGNSSRR